MCVRPLFSALMKIIVLSLFLLLTFMTSCRKDSSAPVGAKNINLVNLTVDDKPYSYTYSNTSITPIIVLKFSEPIDHQSAEGSIFLTGTNGVNAVNYTYANHDSSISITPTSPLHYFGVYSLNILSQLTSTTKKKLDAAKIISIITQIDPTPKFPIITDTALQHPVFSSW